MNKEQAKSLVRWVVTAFGGTLVGWAAGRGWVDGETLMALINSETFIGIVAAGVSLTLSMFKHTVSGTVATVAAIPDDELHKAGIAKILTATNPVGLALADATDGTVVAQIANPSPQTGSGRIADWNRA